MKAYLIERNELFLGILQSGKLVRPILDWSSSFYALRFCRESDAHDFAVYAGIHNFKITEHIFD